MTVEEQKYVDKAKGLGIQNPYSIPECMYSFDDNLKTRTESYCSAHKWIDPELGRDYNKKYQNYWQM